MTVCFPMAVEKAAADTVSVGSRYEEGKEQYIVKQ